jgi:transcriptional regulator with XRE-family HTH domain
MVGLREARAEQLLSIRDLAYRAGVASSTIYLIEAGRTMPSFGVVRRLAAALGVEPREVDEFRRAVEAAKKPPHERRPDTPRRRAGARRSSR